MNNENDTKESIKEYFRNYMRAYRAKAKIQREQKKNYVDNGYLRDYKKKLLGILDAYSFPRAISQELVEYISKNIGNDKVLAIKAEQLLYELDSVGRKLMNEIEILEVIKLYYRKKSAEVSSKTNPKE